MEPKNTKNVDVCVLYDFCFDWQMSGASKQELFEDFRNLGISFEKFKDYTKQLGWWEPSMNQLEMATVIGNLTKVKSILN